MRVLIAEDEAISRHLLKTNLKKWGHEIVECTDGAEAWQAFQQPDPPKLAILDWMMPEIEGIELCRRVRKLPTGQWIYIILLTAKGRQEDKIEGLEAGANDYMTKPFDAAELKARLGVGQRVVELQEKLLEAERDRVLTQTAGAAAHKINQPLTVLIGTTQILRMQMPEDDPNRECIDDLYRAAQKIDQIVKQMNSLRRYVTQPYIEGIEIVDFDAAAKEEQ